MNYLLVIIAVMIALILLTILIWTIINGISPMPTSRHVQRAILRELPEDIEGTVIDLGSGWGHLAIALAKKFPKAQVVGYETSPIPYICSRLARLILGLPNLTFKRESIYSADIHAATLITCYLYPAAMQKLKDMFENECRDDCLIVSHTFRIPSWKARRQIQLDDLYHTPIYFYKGKVLDKILDMH